MVVPCPPVSRDRVGLGRDRKRFRLETRKPEPAISIYSPAEYYRGKQETSERKFEELVQGEVEEGKGVFS